MYLSSKKNRCSNFTHTKKSTINTSLFCTFIQDKIFKKFHKKLEYMENSKTHMNCFDFPIVTVDFTTHGRSHLYGLPCPSADSLDPMDHFCTFDVSNIIPKTCNNFHTQLLIPFSPIYADLTLKPVYIEMCTRGQILSEFSFMRIRLTCLLAFHIPWDFS